MCGIVGYIDNGYEDSYKVEESMKNAIEILKNRGPDDSGLWLDNNIKNLFLGHTRLSILDVSPNGSQPMVSMSGRYVIIYNGEIYNHLELRQECESKLSETNKKIYWKGHSDTETILFLIEIFGVK